MRNPRHLPNSLTLEGVRTADALFCLRKPHAEITSKSVDTYAISPLGILNFVSFI
jgi:hypothetical protein